jgi:hypothetical protein
VLKDSLRLEDFKKWLEKRSCPVFASLKEHLGGKTV